MRFICSLFFEVNIQTLRYLEAPKHCASTHPFGSQYTFTIPRPSIQLQLDSFGKQHRKHAKLQDVGRSEKCAKHAKQWEQWKHIQPTVLW